MKNNLYQLLDQANVKRVKSESELSKPQSLFGRSKNLEDSNQFYLLDLYHKGLYEKICAECQKSQNNFKILFSINESDFKLQVYITQDYSYQKIEYLSLNQLREFPKLFKVIHNKTGENSLQSDLLLLPNENIILGRFSIDKIPIQIPSQIYYNSNPWFEIGYAVERFSLNYEGFEKQSLYVGEINDRYNPINEGYFKNTKFKLSATFADGFFTGKINLEKYSDNKKYVLERNNEKTLLPIYYNQNNLIDFFTFKTIFEGRWINQKILDIYLDQFTREYKMINEKKQTMMNYQNYVINSCDCADIFSSDIFDQQFYLEEKWKAFQADHNIDINNLKNRFILALNLNRSHFIVLVLEFDPNEKQGTIYLLDSIPNPFTKKQFETGQQNIQSLFPNFIIKKEIQRIDKNKIEIQKNGYDCGIHCIYNSIQVFKEKNKKMTDINFKIEDKHKINRLRRHVYLTMVNNYSNFFDY
ncbi:unnamed protein product [Paramecium sonneborni]|uniref:Ubiquitin-like protease family profile domain-containing protein n=1 Tax=Paramecium sonneborni TaxID=65129 RepID=A0A8S1L665_9CILI|nr:unnamed protein product [Paramecium sonneborni]